MTDNPSQATASWLSPAEAAKHAGVSVRTLYRYEARGALRSVRLPSGVRRYRKEDIERLLEPSPTCDTCGAEITDPTAHRRHVQATKPNGLEGGAA